MGHNSRCRVSILRGAWIVFECILRYCISRSLQVLFCRLNLPGDSTLLVRLPSSEAGIIRMMHRRSDGNVRRRNQRCGSVHVLGERRRVQTRYALSGAGAAVNQVTRDVALRV